MLQVKVENLESNQGNKMPNQFRISTSEGVFFQSYDSIIAKVYKGKVYLDERYWDYSKTTSKYRNLFLGEDKKQTQAKINSGEYILIDLN
jgi:hypothetical protein